MNFQVVCGRDLPPGTGQRVLFITVANSQCNCSNLAHACLLQTAMEDSVETEKLNLMKLALARNLARAIVHERSVQPV